LSISDLLKKKRQLFTDGLYPKINEYKIRYISPQMTSYIIVGFPAGGKTRLAERIHSVHPDASLVNSDKYRYTDDKWTKASASEYVERIMAATGDGNYIFETTYFDGSDPEQAKMKAVHALIEAADKKPIVLIRIKNGDLLSVLTDIMTRSLGRAAGTHPQGECVETPENVAKLALKMMTHYHTINAELDNIERLARSKGCQVISNAISSKILTQDV